jgi:CubicO group peptidase (beta-lactamase class C family)
VSRGQGGSPCEVFFNTLGQLVEDISDEPFAAYMKYQVFEPLGTESTDYLLSERVREALAQGYNFSRGRLKPVDYLEITVRGAGSVFSTVEDMCRYVAALLAGGANERGRVLKRATLSLMMEPHYRLCCQCTWRHGQGRAPQPCSSEAVL